MKSWEKTFTSLQGETAERDDGATLQTTGNVPRETGASDAPPPDSSDALMVPPIIESFRVQLADIWSNILLESGGKPHPLMFCGSAPGEGCSFIAFHLALFLATLHSMKTLYVDTSFDQPGHKSFVPDLAGAQGLATFLGGEAPLAALIAPTKHANLYVLPSGAGKANSRLQKNLLEGRVLEELTDYCRDHFDIAIIDGQPVTTRPVAIEFAKRMKNVVLVCRYGSSRREVSMVSMEKLRKNGIQVIGVVLNERQFPVPRALYSLMK